MPWSSCCMGSGCDEPSMETVTSLALGARRRKTTRLSEFTSGETTGRGGEEGVRGVLSCAEAAIAAKKTAKRKKLGFIDPRWFEPFPRPRNSTTVAPHTTVNHAPPGSTKSCSGLRATNQV